MIPSAPLGTDAAAGRPQGLGAAAAAGPDQAAAERRFRFELAAHPGSPAQARRLARARLTGWSVCEDTCDTAALVISELVTNAIVHTASGVVVCELQDGDDLVRIAVRDEGCAPGEPHPSPQRPEEEHGRGLFLVDALCHAWGAEECGPGLLVWADLPRHAEPEPADGEHAHGFAEALEPSVEPEPPVELESPVELVPPVDLPAVDLARTALPAAGLTRAGLVAPRGDLGWGARPKPGPADGSRDDEDSAERGEHGEPGGHGEQRHRGPQDHPAHQNHPAHQDHTAHQDHPVHQDHPAHRAAQSFEAPGWKSVRARWPHRTPQTPTPLPLVAQQRRRAPEPEGAPFERTRERDPDRDPA